MAMSGIAAAAFVPWLYAVLTAATAGAGLSQNVGWIARPGFTQVATLMFGAVGMMASQRLSRLAGFSIITSAGTLLAAIG
jgi:multicomponent K+:H+ antiporter subunit D